MTFQDKINALNAKARQEQNEENDRKEAEARERAKKDDNFYKIFKTVEGSARIRELIAISPPAAQIFMFLAEQADRTNAVVASGKALASYLKISEATVSRALKILSKKDEKNNREAYLEILKSGGTNVFILNPEIVWSAWRTGKDYCLFGNAKILISSDEQDANVKKRLNFVLSQIAKPQLELPDLTTKSEEKPNENA